MSPKTAAPNWFAEARYGLFIHYGLYSLLGRGEWVMNREQIPPGDYRKLADRFTCAKFDAEAICDLAVRAGMRYVVLTTMHHDGFRLYDTALSDFNTMKTASRRDLVAELVAAARKRKLRIGLYQSLNDWTDKPDGVDALEDKQSREQFLRNTFDRIRELVTKFNPIDTLWYDGWWPFNAKGWRAEEMNAMVRKIQPEIIFNGRNGLPGDFATPEGHLSAPTPWRPWEACMTMNGSWGFHRGDHAWKSASDVVAMLATVSAGAGNLLLNIGPRGDGSVPTQSARVLETVGKWLKVNGESIFDTEPFTFDLREKANHRGDWYPHGPITARSNSLYLFVPRWVGEELTFVGLESKVKNAMLLCTKQKLRFHQTGSKIVLRGLPKKSPDPVCPVIRLECDRPPSMYTTAGMRVPRVPHPHYDPCPSDIMH